MLLDAHFMKCSEEEVKDGFEVKFEARKPVGRFLS